MLVAVDREQEGREALAQAGLTLYAGWQISELLEFYVAENLITELKGREVLEYLAAYQ